MSSRPRRKETPNEKALFRLNIVHGIASEHRPPQRATSLATRHSVRASLSVNKKVPRPTSSSRALHVIRRNHILLLLPYDHLAPTRAEGGNTRAPSTTVPRCQLVSQRGHRPPPLLRAAGAELPPASRTSIHPNPKRGSHETRNVQAATHRTPHISRAPYGNPTQ